MKKRVPQFTSEDQERKFWARVDSTRYVNWANARRAVLPELKPSLTIISLRLPDLLLAERIRQEFGTSRVRPRRSSSALQRPVHSASRR